LQVGLGRAYRLASARGSRSACPCRSPEALAPPPAWVWWGSRGARDCAARDTAPSISTPPCRQHESIRPPGTRGRDGASTAAPSVVRSCDGNRRTALTQRQTSLVHDWGRVVCAPGGANLRCLSAVYPVERRDFARRRSERVLPRVPTSSTGLFQGTRRIDHKAYWGRAYGSGRATRRSRA